MGLSPQSETVSTTTQPAPPQFPDAPVFPDDPVIVLDIDDVEFTLAGEDLDTIGTCSETDVASISDACTINIETKSPVLAVDGTVDSDDWIIVRTNRNLAEMNADIAATTDPAADQDDLRGEDQTVTLTFPEGRSLLRIFGDEDETFGGGELYHFRVNVVPYWEMNGQRLSKDSACQATTANAPTVDEITDEKCIIRQSGRVGSFRFYNVIKEQFNEYVDVNATRIISEPETTTLIGRFARRCSAGRNQPDKDQACRRGQPAPRRSLRRQILLLQGDHGRPGQQPWADNSRQGRGRPGPRNRD